MSQINAVSSLTSASQSKRLIRLAKIFAWSLVGLFVLGAGCDFGTYGSRVKEQQEKLDRMSTPPPVIK